MTQNVYIQIVAPSPRFKLEMVLVLWYSGGPKVLMVNGDLGTADYE